MPPKFRRILASDSATVQTVYAPTELTPELQISIVRTGTPPHPETAEVVLDGVAFIEALMQIPLPTKHVIVILDGAAVAPGGDGSNYGFAIGYLPKYEQEQQDAWMMQDFQFGLIHEISHYYWRGNEGWVNEGLAVVAEYAYGIFKGSSLGQLRTRARAKDCEAHDLSMLSDQRSREWGSAIPL